MPRDHYIAETYLKHFLGNDGFLHVYRKSDGKYFPARPRDICHEWDGDIIQEFLANPNLLGEYRNLFEPAWNPAVAQLASGRVSREDKLAISGYLANLLVCTPAWRRISIKGNNANLLHTLKVHDALNTKHGKPDIKIKEALAALDSGQFKLDTKPDFIRAICARHLMQYAWIFYNSNWLILRNDTATGFITSDNPAAFDDPGPWRGQQPRLPRHFPITPGLCVSCDMTLAERHDSKPNFSLPPLGTVTATNARPAEVKRVNKAIVLCAEDFVILSQKTPSLEALTRKYATWRIDMEIIEDQTEDAHLFGMRTRVRRAAS